MHEKLSEYLAYSSEVIRNIERKKEAIEEAITICVQSLTMGNKIIFCGNGGSAAEAQHFSAEFTGKFLQERPPMSAIALTVDTSAMSAIGNDYGFDAVFSRQLKAIGKSGDVLIGMSTSGKSRNVIEAFKLANQLDIKTVALIGNYEKEIAPFSDVIISAESSRTNFIQEAHLIIGHFICGVVESKMIKIQ